MQEQQNILPFITQGMPPIPGEIKTLPSHFMVEEIPLYQAEGKGEHIYLRIQREGITTRSLQKSLALEFDLKENSVGYAGLKDKQAITTQTFSLHLHTLDPKEAAKQVEKNLNVKVLNYDRHLNKLKRGHLLGNSFKIFLASDKTQDLSLANDIAQTIQERGLPNFYGEQRFGKFGDNAELGRNCLLGKGPRKKWLRTLVLNAYQSSLFNIWLTKRIQRNEFATLIKGDVAKKTETGGIFVVEDLATDQARFQAGEITYTGPIYGSKMRWAQDIAGEWERSVLEQEEIEEKAFAKARLTGSRRPARLDISGMVIEQTEGGLWFSFALPKGSYATTVMREFTKNQEFE